MSQTLSTLMEVALSATPLHGRPWFKAMPKSHQDKYTGLHLELKNALGPSEKADAHDKLSEFHWERANHHIQQTGKNKTKDKFHKRLHDFHVGRAEKHESDMDDIAGEIHRSPITRKMQIRLRNQKTPPRRSPLRRTRR